jgi:hypothetical protein
MKLGGIYQHENCTDAAILVLQVQYEGETLLGLLVSWINVVNPDNAFPMNYTETIEIKREELAKWKMILSHG